MPSINRTRVPYTGRIGLYATPPAQVTSATVGAILDLVLPHHITNASESADMRQVYRGNQTILNRTKDIRSEINNKIVENRSFELVEFKKGYEFSHPLQLISVTEKDNTSQVAALNAYARIDTKETKDVRLAEDMYITGAGYRYVANNLSSTVDDAPYITAVLPPETTGVVYSTSIGNPRLLSFTYRVEYDEQNHPWTRMGAYYGKQYFEWRTEGNTPSGRYGTTKAVVDGAASLFGNPIIEYRLNDSRLGYVELALPLTDAINNLNSNRLDAVEQFVQALLVFVNCELETDAKGNPVLPKTGDAVVVKGTPQLPASVNYLLAQLDQGGTQITKEDLLNAMYEVTGMPSRQTRASGGGDTGQAVVLRNGWGAAEARAKTTEKMFKESENEYLRIVLAICRAKEPSAAKIGDLTLFDIDTRFTRNRSDNLQVKTQALETMLRAGVDGEDAFEASELFPDPAAAYEKSRATIEAIRNPQVTTQVQAPDGNITNTNADAPSEGDINSTAIGGTTL